MERLSPSNPSPNEFHSAVTGTISDFTGADDWHLARSAQPDKAGPNYSPL